MSCEHSTCISGGLAEGIVKIGQHGQASRDYIYIYIYIYIYRERERERERERDDSCTSFISITC